MYDTMMWEGFLAEFLYGAVSQKFAPRVKKEGKALQPIRAFISDLDDTLLTEDHGMSDRTAETLRRVLRQGVKVVLASGRSAASIRPFVRKVGTPYPYIAYNGAQIVDAKTHEVLHASEVPEALAREVLRWLEDKGVYAQFYGGDDWFYAEENPFAESYARSTGVAGTRIGTLSAHLSGPTAKVLAVDDPARIQALIAEGRERFGDALMITTSKPYFMEVTSPGATKGKAVAKLAGMIGLAPETTLCAGDSLNDMSMLTWSARPIAVLNARAEVKAVAWRVAGDGRHDGIAALLDELIPEEYHAIG